MLKAKQLLLFAAVLGALAAGAQEAAQAIPVRRVALIVQNHAAPDAGLPMMALTDALAAKLSGRGFQVVNPYNVVGSDQNRGFAGETTPQVSALELARGLGAEGVVTAAVLELNDTALGNPPLLRQYTIRLSFSLADAVTGAVVGGETVKVKSPKYTVNQAAANRHEYLGELLHAAAAECAERLEANPAVQAWRPLARELPPPQAVGATDDGLDDAPAAPQPWPSQQPPPIARGAAKGTILDRKADALMREMLANPQFVRNYEASQARQDGRLPVVVLGGLENKTGVEALAELVAAAGERFRVRLFNSKLFEVKDDGVLVALARRIVASGNSPLEDGELMGALKQHGSPDFFVAGELRALTDLDGVGYYKLRLAIHSLSTGKIVWEGIETFTQAREEAK